MLHLTTRGQSWDVRNMNKRDAVIWGARVVGVRSKAESSEGLGWGVWREGGGWVSIRGSRVLY